MVLYVSIFLGLYLTGYITKQSRSVAPLIVWALFLVVFAGTREYTGCDFTGYLNRFYSYQSGIIDYTTGRSELLFALLNMLVIWSSLDYMWLNVFSSAIIFYGFTRFANRCEYPLYFIALSFPILIVQLSMSGIRQAIALAFVMLSLNAFRDGKRLTMAALIVLGGLFHASAFVFLPLVFMIGRSPSIWTLLLSVAAISPVALLLGSERIDTYHARYIEGDIESAGAIFRVSLLVITAVAFELYRSEFQRLFPKDYPLMRIFSLASFAVAAIFLVSTLAAHRLAYYIMPVHLIILLRLPYVLNSIRKNDLVAAFPFALYFSYLVFWFSFSRHARICYIPYNSYLF